MRTKSSFVLEAGNERKRPLIAVLPRLLFRRASSTARVINFSRFVNNQMQDNQIPVTVLSGNLGAGKTTLLNHVLRETDDDIAVLVNDMGEVNVDAEHVAEESDISEDDEEIVELSDGCICCELRGDLLDAVGKLAQKGGFDHLLIESTGVAEPLPVAQTLTLGFGVEDIDPTEFYEETGVEPMEFYELDTTVTVVDAHQFWDAMNSDGSLMDGDTEKPLADLLVEQVEFCDVLVLNKCDLVSDEDIDEIEETVRKLQPRAEVVRTEHGRIDPDEVLGTGLFDFDEASESAGWLRELREPHASAEEEHGVKSFVFEAERPFRPERFADFLDDLPTGIVRSKGHFWLAGRDEAALALDIAGQSVRIGYGGDWIAALPEEERDEILDENPELRETWDEKYGDRDTRLVVIGVDIDRRGIHDRLEDCVLDDEEMEADWTGFEDRFPEFVEPEEAENDETEHEHGDRGEEVGLAD